MQTLKRAFIIGLGLMLMLINSNAHAIYSPIISGNVVQIRDHITSSQAQNGVGSLMEVSQTIVSQYKNKRDAGKPTGIGGSTKKAQQKIILDALAQSAKPLALYDSILMSFNVLPSQGGGVISNCLRDDIWALESLKDVVGEEMIKAYMLSDLVHGDQLSRDYDYLVEEIDLLRRQGNNPNAEVLKTVDKEGKPIISYLATQEYAAQSEEEIAVQEKEGTKPDYITMKKYLFGDEVGVYYYNFAFPNEGGCPEGDFEQAFIRVANSAKTLARLSTGQGTAMNSRPGAANWGNIWEMAEVRAKQRAAQWFAANQISLTVGGGQGGQSQSLIKDNGWDQRMAEMQTQIRILKNLAGPVTAPFSLDIYQNVDGVDIVGGEYNCVVFEPDLGTYFPCTKAQFEKFQKCNLTVEEAIKEGLIDDKEKKSEEKFDLKKEKNKLNCGRFTSTQSSQSLTEVWASSDEKSRDGQLHYQSELLAFQYQVQFDDIAEDGLNKMADELVKLEDVIRKGVETDGNDEDKGLLAFGGNMSTMLNRHCPNKVYSKEIELGFQAL